MNSSPSMFRHLYGTHLQSHEIVRNVNLGSVYLSSNPLRANHKWMAFPWNAPRGTILIHPVAKPGAIPDSPALLSHEFGQPFNGFDFHPFNDDLLAAIDAEGAIHLFNIPEDGLTETLEEPTALLEGHEKRGLGVHFHPTANNVLLSHDGGKTVKLWDIAAEAEQVELPASHKGLIQSVSWNTDGNQVCTFAKDKKLRIFDPRSSTVVAEVAGHEGAKGAQALWTTGKVDRIISLGFAKSPAQRRDMFVYDPRNMDARLQEQIVDQQSSSSLYPFYDEDIALLFVAGKGDGNMRLYEVGSDEVTYLNEHKANVPMSGLALLPKDMANVAEMETHRLLKLSPNVVDTITFTIPRSHAAFDAEIYPDTWDGQACIEAADWFAGGEAAAKTLKSLDPDQ